MGGAGNGRRDGPGAYGEDHGQKACFGVSGIEVKCSEWPFPNSHL